MVYANVRNAYQKRRVLFNEIGCYNRTVMVQIMLKASHTGGIRAALMLRLLGIVLLMGFSISASQAAKEPPDEVKLGKEASAELEKQYKVIKDEALQTKINKIGDELAQIANDTEVPATYGSSKITKFKYTFKILDDKDVNALSMPGGFIYINKGLIDYVQSDDELAGVIAHEISHIAHHHMLSLVKEQAKLNNQLALALLAAMLSRIPATDMGNVMMGARFVQIAKLNGYSRQAEEDADTTGLAYLSKSKYNPVGMLTFMERLARDEMGHSSVDWGVYQTHPYPGDRSRTLEALLKSKGIDINRRLVTKAAVAEVKKSKTDGLYDVWLGNAKFFTPANTEKTSEARANETADKLNRLLNAGLRLREIKQTLEPPVITARGEVILETVDADAALQAPKSPAQIARESFDVLYKVLFNQELDKVY